jgi:hypothetical protein
LIHSRINKFQGSFGTHTAREPGERAGGLAGAAETVGFGAPEGLEEAAIGKGFKGMSDTVGSAGGVAEGVVPEERFEGGEGLEPGVDEGEGGEGAGFCGGFGAIVGQVGAAFLPIAGAVAAGEDVDLGVETVSAGVSRGLGLALSGDGATRFAAVPAGGFALGCRDGSLQQQGTDGGGCGHNRNLLGRG